MTRPESTTKTSSRSSEWAGEGVAGLEAHAPRGDVALPRDGDASPVMAAPGASKVGADSGVMTGTCGILFVAVGESVSQGELTSQAPDFALLVVGASRPVAERLNAAVAAAGIGDMRSPYGFVIRALARAPLG